MDRILDLRAPKEFTHDTVKAMRGTHRMGQERRAAASGRRSAPSLAI